MPSQIALLFCIIFIVYLFKTDSKGKSNVSPALWIPLIWMILIASRPIGSWFDPQVGAIAVKGGYVPTVTDIGGNPIARNIYTLLLVIGLFILSRRKIDWSQIFKNNLWIFLFFLYCGISILWSDFPFVSFKRWIKVIGHLVMVLIVLTESKPVEGVKTIISRCSYVLIPLSILLIKYYPDLGMKAAQKQPIYIGVTGHKNSLGHLCLASAIFFAWHLITIWRQKNVSFDKKKILFLLMIWWLLSLANSATALVCLISGICILIGLDIPILKNNVKFIGYTVLFISLCSLPFLTLSENPFVSSVVGATGHASTFWGRTELWKELIDMVANPLTGTGFESFWMGDRLQKIWAEHSWHPNQAHNGYVETYLHLGQIGLFLLIGVIVSVYRKILTTLFFDFDYGKFRMACLIIVLLFNVTEAAFRGLHLMFFIFLLISIDIPSLTQNRTTK